MFLWSRAHGALMVWRVFSVFDLKHKSARYSSRTHVLLDTIRTPAYSSANPASRAVLNEHILFRRDSKSFHM